MIQRTFWLMALFFCLTPTNSAHAQQRQKIILNDGSIIVGIVEEMNPKIVIVKTTSGTLRIPRHTIRKITFIQAGTPDNPPQTNPPQTNPPDENPPPNYNRRRNRRYRRYRYNRRPYYVNQNPRKGALIAGIICLSVGYGVPVLIGAFGSLVVAPTGSTVPAELLTLMIPLAGPFVTLGLLSANNNSSSVVPAFAPPLIILGIAQAAGLGLTIFGALGKSKRIRISQHRSPPSAIAALPPVGFQQEVSSTTLSQRLSSP